MTDVEECRSDKKSNGCGVKDLYNGFFRRRSFCPRRTSSASAIPAGASNSKRRRGGSFEAAFINHKAGISAAAKPNAGGEKYIVTRSPLTSNGPPPPNRYHVAEAKPSSQIVSSAGNIGAAAMVPGRRASKGPTTISGELEAVMPELRTRGNLVRASSSNMMVFGHLGNIQQSRPPSSNVHSNSNSNSVLDYLPMTAKEKAAGSNAKPAGGMGNILRKQAERESQTEPEVNLCRVLSRRLEPEELKELGNEEFKKGKYEEALAYYDLAISLDPSKAAYRSNRSAALTGLGRLLEAVEDCMEAVRIDSRYHRAHHRLATLYLRLGEADKALSHYKQSGKESNPKEIAQAQALRNHLTRCSEARKLRDWRTMLKEAGLAISAGADSAPQAFALQAEALLKLHRHQEADTTLTSAPNFDPDALIKILSASSCAYYFLAAAQVDMASGRFEEAVAAAQRAARLEPGNKEAGMMVRRARAVAAARGRGNELFKAGKYSEACAAYSEGLEQDQINAVLLCNRAACRSKLGQWEKAIEDCSAALNVRPSYSKARLRRADCNAKMEKWEASVLDYEELVRETPGDEEVIRALAEAQAQLKKQHGEDWVGSDVVVVTSSDLFRQLVTSPGVSVVLFYKMSSNSSKQASFIARLCKRFTSVTFLKVEIDEHPFLAKSEGVSFVPCFNIYRGGSKVKYVDGDNPDLLESSIKNLSS